MLQLPLKRRLWITIKLFLVYIRKVIRKIEKKKNYYEISQYSQNSDFSQFSNFPLRLLKMNDTSFRREFYAL